MVKIRLKSCQRTFWTIPDQKTWDMPCSNSLPKQICRVLKRVMHDLYMISTSFSIISRHNHSILPKYALMQNFWRDCTLSNRVTFTIQFELEEQNENVKSRSKIQLVGRIISIWRVIFEEFKYLAPNWPRQAVSTHYQEKTFLLFTVVIWAGLNSGRLSLAGLSRLKPLDGALFM